ncbi:MAG: hypothetical protein R3B74_06855 [Nitrospirales bacterium]|nr:hypothetical protein [Nitrospirales bacterium]
MKNGRKSNPIIVLGSLAGTCLLATVAFGNPSMLPEHPGYPMKGSQSPVTDVSTAYDAGQENLYENKALNAASTSYNKGMKIRRAGQLMGVDQTEEPNEPSGQEHMTRQN